MPIWANIGYLCVFYIIYDYKLNKFIKIQKDVLSQSSQSNVVYKIDCDASYVGQTSRCLKTHISEHRNHINRTLNIRLSHNIWTYFMNLIEITYIF